VPCMSRLKKFGAGAIAAGYSLQGATISAAGVHVMEDIPTEWRSPTSFG